MKRLLLLAIVFAAGCSTAPVADVLDWARPGRIGPGPYRGGVANQHGATVAPPAPIVPAVPAPLPPVPPPAGSGPVS